ncbi:hypothetical protein B0T14DRAFT_559369 [Immersiella caudata]|uniref:Uncharacterized protein n=1 Tax=Immersiella caudata TaxID=314043 RepID=A0AA39XCV2_9PEZI|nr:hypothetical protein B0T14DRAFT_559369 [Immersiella caudata]
MPTNDISGVDVSQKNRLLAIIRESQRTGHPMPSPQSTTGISAGGDCKMGNTADQIGPSRAPPRQGVAGVAQKLPLGGAPQPIPSIAKLVPTTPGVFGTSTVLPHRGPSMSGANGYANVHEWVAANGSQQVPRGPSQMQASPRLPQPLAKAPVRTGANRMPITAPTNVHITGRPTQSTYQWSVTTSVKAKPEASKAPTVSLSGQAPVETLSKVCQRRHHNLEWKKEMTTTGLYSFSVWADGKVYRAPKAYREEREAKMAAAKVALAGLGITPWAGDSALQASAASANKLPLGFVFKGGDIFFTPSNLNKTSATTGGPTATNGNKTAPDTKGNGNAKEEELKSILKRLQTIFGSELKDRSRDPPPVAKAFLEGLSVGSRIAFGNMDSKEVPRGKENQRPRHDLHRPTRRTRSRSPSRDLRRTYRERDRESSQTTCIKQEVLSSPSAARGNSVTRDTRPVGRGNGFPTDRRWEHDKYSPRYSRA